MGQSPLGQSPSLDESGLTDDGSLGDNLGDGHVIDDIDDDGLDQIPPSMLQAVSPEGAGGSMFPGSVNNMASNSSAPSSGGMSSLSQQQATSLSSTSSFVYPQQHHMVPQQQTNTLQYPGR
jgi:hypothetical protein